MSGHSEDTDPSVVISEGRKLIIGKGDFPMSAPLYCFYIHALNKITDAAGQERQYDPDTVYKASLKCEGNPIKIDQADFGYGEINLNVEISKDEMGYLKIDVTDYEEKTGVDVNQTLAISIFESCGIQAVFDDSDSEADDTFCP